MPMHNHAIWACLYALILESLQISEAYVSITKYMTGERYKWLFAGRSGEQRDRN